MPNLVGIDVGGTYTDAVLIKDGRIEQTAKVPTLTENLVDTLMNALDGLHISAGQTIDRLTVSTTLVTNAILQDKLAPTKLILFPGQGMRLDALPWPVSYTELSGEMDFRGREIEAPDQTEWQKLSASITKTKPANLAIVGKFSHRNCRHEQGLADYLNQAIPTNPVLGIGLGHEWGKANFYRRSLTTYLNLGVSAIYQEFARHLETAVLTRNIQAPIFILKADGGSLPLAKIRPVDSIYSGPAASVLAALAQIDADASAIVVDIGGTTTDIGLVLSGVPLLSSQGAQIGSFSTLVRSLSVRSIPVGGDSVVRATDQEFVLENYRLGPAYCLGGPEPTPTDAMRYLELIDFGSKELAEEGLSALLPGEGRTSEAVAELARAILQTVIERITTTVDSIKREWQEEPAYKVWEVLHPQQTLSFKTIVTGGAAQGISVALGESLGTPVQLGYCAETSNAMGTAMARPTFDCTLHVDTYMKKYRVEETGEQGVWTGALRPYHEIEGFLDNLVQQQITSYGLDKVDIQIEKEPFDYFPIVINYRTVGQIVYGAAHQRAGVTGRVEV